MQADVSDRYVDHRQDPGCPCRSCRRHAALRGSGVSLVNGFEPDDVGPPQRRGEPDVPPQHPVTGKFMAALHPDHDDRDVRGRFADGDLYD
jgi:hypothetical protein